MQSNQTGKKVGWVCTYTPEELIYAAGFTPTRVTPNEAQNTSSIEDIFPNSICPFVRQIMNLGREDSGQLEDLCNRLKKQTGIKLSEEKFKEVLRNVNEARQYQLGLPSFRRRNHIVKKTFAP